MHCQDNDVFYLKSALQKFGSNCGLITDNLHCIAIANSYLSITKLIKEHNL